MANTSSDVRGVQVQYHNLVILYIAVVKCLALFVSQ